MGEGARSSLQSLGQVSVLQEELVGGSPLPLSRMSPVHVNISDVSERTRIPEVVDSGSS